MSFESLPLELNLIILQNIADPATLFALFRASPVHYEIFQSSQQQQRQHEQKTPGILARIVLNVITPELLQLAIDVCEATSIKSERTRMQLCAIASKRNSNSSSSSYQDAYSGALRSMKKTFERKIRKRIFAERRETTTIWDTSRNKARIESSYIEKLRDLDLLKCLCRLLTVVDWFIADFTRGARALLEVDEREREYLGTVGLKDTDKGEEEASRSGLGVCIIAPAVLSQFEYLRLQRAFLHFELYRHILGGLERYGRYPGLIFSYLRYDEPDGLLSVYDYLMARMEKAYDDLEMYFDLRLASAMATEVNDTTHSNVDWEPDPNSPWPKFHKLPRYVQDIEDRQIIWLNTLASDKVQAKQERCERKVNTAEAEYGKSEARKQCSNIEKKLKLAPLIDLGLPFFKSFLRMDNEQQLRIILDTSHLECREMFEDVVNRSCADGSTTIGRVSFDEDASRVKSGYLFKGPRIRISPDNQDAGAVLSAIRRRGFFFWECRGLPGGHPSHNGVFVKALGNNIFPSSSSCSSSPSFFQSILSKSLTCRFSRTHGAHCHSKADNENERENDVCWLNCDSQLCAATQRALSTVLPQWPDAARAAKTAKWINELDYGCRN